MKSPHPLGFHLPSLAVAACLVFGSEDASAATPYREETHGPRVGSRILNFFKDIAYGENPNNRYRTAPPPGQRPPQQPYNNRPPAPMGQRYSLDQPPMPYNGPRQPMPRGPQGQQNPNFTPNGNPGPNANQPPQQSMPPGPAPASRDLPYEAPPETVPNDDRETPQAGIGGQREDIPSVKIKGGGTVAAKTSPTQRVAPDVQTDKKLPPPVKTDAPQPQQKTLPPSQVAENTVPNSKKAWQNPPVEGLAPTSTTPSTVTPPVEQPPPPTTVQSGDATLIGSKTARAGRVKSPYPPYQELDVTGLPTGSLAMDPTTGKVFRVP